MAALREGAYRAPSGPARSDEDSLQPTKSTRGCRAPARMSRLLQGLDLTLRDHRGERVASPLHPSQRAQLEPRLLFDDSLGDEACDGTTSLGDDDGLAGLAHAIDQRQAFRLELARLDNHVTSLKDQSM